VKYILDRSVKNSHFETELNMSLEQHRGKTSAHAPNYENMAGNLNINFQNKNMLIHWSNISKTNEKI
jgi:hypothetical protein